MKNKIACLSFWIALIASSICANAQQDPPNDVNATPSSGIASAAGKLAGTPVNLYTGMPGISIPLYNYSHRNGLSLNLSLDYFSGGAKINELPTQAGLNWYLNAGGIITRTVRGMPDELFAQGYHYAPALPADPTVNARAYYYDSLDAEMDVFQFDFNGRSGKFTIGKNGQALLTPLSKMKISYDTSILYDGSIIRFRITTEDGVKYVFSDIEFGTLVSDPFKSGYSGDHIYTRAWYLSQIIAPFGTDTIKFTYNSIQETTSIGYPQTVYVRTADGNASQKYTPAGTQLFTFKKVAGIQFPDKKNISLLYDDNFKYDHQDSLISYIKISDSIFRFGYIFDWNCCIGNPVANSRALLAGVRYYTNDAMRPAYQFTYGGTIFPAVGTSDDTLVNNRDHWGYYNGAHNGANAIPAIAGLYSGANRDPSPTAALSSALNSITDPSGGITRYKFESNDLPQYEAVGAGFDINAINNTQTTISLAQVFNDLHTITIASDINYGHNHNLTGSCPFTCTVTSLNGATTYGSLSTTLYKAASSIVSFSFHAPNGSYLVSTTTSSCSSNLTNVDLQIFWQNQVLSGTAMTSGGIRLKQQSHFDPTTGRTDTIATYNYKNEDGSSSGFLGALPIYTYPYQQTVINGSTVTTSYTAISSDPINNLNYTQGSPVGYSRVEVIQGSPTHNLGKEVYEFTNLKDANASLVSPSFPYAPLSQRDWRMGLPKRVTVFDNTGRLISVKQNTYQDTVHVDSSVNCLSRKLGKIAVTYNGDPNFVNTPKTELYASQDYYPETGLSLLVKSIDSFYHSDNSLQVVEKDYQYDTNFNVVKVISPFDPTRGLSMEKRLYYPYNYTVSGAIGQLRDSGLISAVVSTEDWITGDATPRMTGAQVTDFTQLSKGHVKPSTLYTLQSNAPVSQAAIGAFNPASLVRNSAYLVPQENLLTYDSTGNLLESKNSLSGRRSSVIMDYNNQFAIAKVSNAGLADIAYTSFESDGTGSWNIPSAARSTNNALTGKYSYNLTSGNITRTGLASSVNYLVSVWGFSGSAISVNGAPLTSAIAQQNNWNLYQVNLTGITTITVSGNGLIDELRLHPKDANMATTTYEPMIGPTSSCDANNTVQYFFYDLLNRANLVRDKDLNIIKKLTRSDSTILISHLPIWQATGPTPCETPFNGNIDRQEMDINSFSPTFKSLRLVFDHKDCTGSCKPPCAGPVGKLVNCVCESGIRSNISTVRIKVDCCNFKWKCTYAYCWSDGSGSATFNEINDNPCSITGICSQ